CPPAPICRSQNSRKSSKISLCPRCRGSFQILTMTCTTARLRRAILGCRTIFPRVCDLGAKHNSLLIVTWDEDEQTEGNHIATIFRRAHGEAWPVRRDD